MSRLSQWTLLLTLTILLSACGESYTGPIADMPVQTKSLKRLFDVVLAQGVPEIPLRQAFAYFDQHLSIIVNRRVLSIIDFTKPSSDARLYIINLSSGDVDHLWVAHGEGSDPDNTGYARTFSNLEGSKASSLGFYLAAEPYKGKYGPAVRLDGLDFSNSNARERAIVLHGADYVNPAVGHVGRSWGCPAIELSQVPKVVPRLQGQSLLYAYIEGM